MVAGEMTEDAMQSPGHRVTADGAASHSLGMQHVMSCPGHGHGLCHHPHSLSLLSLDFVHHPPKPQTILLSLQKAENGV